MVNTKQSNSDGNHTTQKEPSSNGNVSNSKPLQDISSTIDNARPDLNSPPTNNNYVPDMNEGERIWLLQVQEPWEERR